jgi:hypothetical protein
LHAQVEEGMVIKLLEDIGKADEGAKATKVTIHRKTRADDSDDDDDF